MIKRAFGRVGTYFYFLPSYKLAKKVIWDNIDNEGFRMLDHIPKEIIKSINATELKIELINGSIIQLIAADEFKSGGVGTNPIGVVFSEYSITSPDAWQYVSPILAVNGGWAIFNFTPRGTNHAYTLLQQAKNNGWFNEILTVNETKVLTLEQIEEESRLFPKDLIDQEYFCKFIEGAGAFFRGIEQNIWLAPDKPEPGHVYRMGVDLAKFQDYTVITLLDLNTFKIHKQIRFNQLDYVTQKAKIESEYLRYNKPLIYMDSTGVGEPIYDDLSARGLRVEPYKFTYESRMDLLRNLQILLEQNKVKIPNDEILQGELKSFRYILSERGKIKVEVPEGLHDDCVMSLALSVWNLPRNPVNIDGDAVTRLLNKKNNNIILTQYD